MTVKEIEQHYNVTILCVSVHGSNLYKLNLPNSDKDYKGVFLPNNIDDILLNKYPKQIDLNTGNNKLKNSKNDIDYTLFSLDEFFKNLKKSQTWAFEVLFSNNFEYKTEFWDKLVEHRKEMVSTNVNALLGYMKSQHSKYINKSENYTLMKKYIDFLKNYSPNDKLYNLPLKNTYTMNKCGFKDYDFAGLKFTETVSVKNVLNALEKKLSEVGFRTITASENNGVDWKAFHHALRILTQAKLLMTKGEWSYPLPNTKFLLQVKQGKISYEKATEYFEKLYNKVENLTKLSVKEATFDFDKFLVDTYKDKLRSEL